MATQLILQYQVDSVNDVVASRDPVLGSLTRKFTVTLYPVSASGNLEVSGALVLSKEFPANAPAPAISVGDPVTLTVDL